MTVTDASTPVFILKCEHYGALGIARSLGRLGIPVYGVDGFGTNPTFASRYCKGTFSWDIDGESPADSVEFLLRAGRRVGGTPILIPTSDETSMFVATEHKALSQQFRFPHIPCELVSTLTDKYQMGLLAAHLGIPTAKTSLVHSARELVDGLDSMTFPVLLKGRDGAELEKVAGFKMLIVKNREDLLRISDRMHKDEWPGLMLQEYIPGGDDSVWMFNGYFDSSSRCLFSMTGQKLRQNPAYTGMTSLGVCRNNWVVAGRTRHLAKKVGYRGIIDIGYRFDKRDGTYKVLDINPRIGATFRLFVDTQGIDVARALYCDLTGQQIPLQNPSEGRKWIVEDTDLKSSVQYIRDGALTPGRWLRSLVGVREAGYFALDDVRPALARLWYHFRRQFTRVVSGTETTGLRSRKPPANAGKTDGNGHRELSPSLMMQSVDNAHNR